MLFLLNVGRMVEKDCNPDLIEGIYKVFTSLKWLEFILDLSH